MTENNRSMTGELWQGDVQGWLDRRNLPAGELTSDTQVCMTVGQVGAVDRKEQSE